jgi:hypothetical protein
VSGATRVGRIDSIRYTRNAFGEQYTTIDGVTYVTWFDLANPKLAGLHTPGARVRFTSVNGPTKMCDAPRVTVECGRATLIEVVGHLPCLGCAREECAAAGSPGIDRVQSHHSCGTCPGCEGPLRQHTVNGECKGCWDREITREKDEERAR